jgi:hypothetical protein
MEVLTRQWGSVNFELSPMVLVAFDRFKAHGRTPRSSDDLAVALEEAVSASGADLRIVFISHNWMRGDEEQCKRNGHRWDGTAHPDDEKGTKHRLMCAGVERLAGEKGWDLGKVYIWLDYCCIEQDDNKRKWAGVESLRGYVTVCDAVLVPYPEPPAKGATTVAELSVYGERGWTRLEAMVAYVGGLLKGLDFPELWVTWGAGDGGQVELRRFEYSLDEEHLPASCGKEFLKDERDRDALKVCHPQPCAFVSLRACLCAVRAVSWAMQPPAPS